MQRCVIYHRVSTPSQSTSNTVAMLGEYAHSREWCIAGVFTETVSGGAALKKRSRLLRAVKMLSEGDVLLVASACRLARSVEIAGKVRSMVEQRGAAIVEAEAGSPARKALLGHVVDAFEEYGDAIKRREAARRESRSPSQVIGELQAYLAANGIKFLNRVHLSVAGEGFVLRGIDFSDSNDLTVLTAHDQELAARAEVVELILSLRANGTSFRQIARRLGIEGGA